MTADLGRRTIEANLASLRTGESNGKIIYAALSHYAHENDLQFIQDTGGLSEQGLLRRTENMLSSALKYGTTRHLDIGRDMARPNFEWARPIKWKRERSTDDYFHNLRELLETSYHNVSTLVPDVDAIRFNFEQGVFENEQGREFTDADFENFASDVRLAYSRSRAEGEGGESGARPSESDRIRAVAFGDGEVPIGRSTLKRAAWASTWLREESGETRRRLLDELVLEWSSGVSEALAELYYSQSQAPAEAGVSASKADDLVGQLNRRARRSLIDSGLVQVVQSVNDLPGSHPGNVSGAWLDGQIYIVADNTAPESFDGVLLHELGVHHGLQDMLQESGLNYSGIVRQVQRQVERCGELNGTTMQLLDRGHARSCGGDDCDGHPLPVHEGPSPRARGTRMIAAFKAGRDGTIPAGAGNTAGAWMLSPHSPVHPRGRGEHGPDQSGPGP